MVDQIVEKPCIDNVLTTIEESISHHSYVFSVSNMLHGSSCKEALAVHYDYSESKILGKAQLPNKMQMVTHIHIKRTAATSKH